MTALRPKKQDGATASRHYVLGGALILIAVALYLNTLGHGFVFDDGALILQNPAVSDLRWDLLMGSGSYRPVRTLTYALNYLLGGTDPWGYHLFNLLLHGVNAWLLFRLLALWSGAGWAAFGGALMFVVHPVQTAAVSYVSGRKDLLATLFLLAAVDFYTRYRREGGKGRLAATLVLALLAMLSKEVALVFPGMLILVELLVLARQSASGLLARAKDVTQRFWLPIVGALALAGAGLYHAVYISQATRMSGWWGGSPAANFGTSFKLFVHYLKLVFWPHPLIADYKGEVFPVSTGVTEPATLFSGLVLAAFVVLAARQTGKRPLLAMGMGWFLLTLLPVLQLIPFHELAADHFLYLPLAGVAMAVTHVFASGLKPNQLRPAWGILAAVAVLFSGMTVVRNRDWKDAETLWRATYAAAPGSQRALVNLGQYQFRNPATRRQGLEMTRRAVEMLPDDPVAVSNLGAMEFVLARDAVSQGDDQRAYDLLLSAREHLEKALQQRRSDGSILTNLGSVEKLLGLLEQRRGNATAAHRHRRQAILRFKQALARDSRKEIRAAWYNMALAYLDLGEYAHAASALRQFLKDNPRNADAYLRLGYCRIQLGDYQGAIPPLRGVTQIQPSPQAYELLAVAHENLGQTEEAIRAIKEGLQKFPRVQFLQRRLATLEGK